MKWVNPGTSRTFQRPTSPLEISLWLEQALNHQWTGPVYLGEERIARVTREGCKDPHTGQEFDMMFCHLTKAARDRHLVYTPIRGS